MQENPHTVQPLEEPQDALVLMHGSQGLIMMLIPPRNSLAGCSGSTHWRQGR